MHLFLGNFKCYCATRAWMKMQRCSWDEPIKKHLNIGNDECRIFLFFQRFCFSTPLSKIQRENKYSMSYKSELVSCHLRYCWRLNEYFAPAFDLSMQNNRMQLCMVSVIEAFWNSTVLNKMIIKFNQVGRVYKYFYLGKFMFIARVQVSRRKSCIEFFLWKVIAYSHLSI